MQTRDEYSAGGVAVRPNADSVAVAIIRTHEGRWQLPKGGIEDETSLPRKFAEKRRRDSSLRSE